MWSAEVLLAVLALVYLADTLVLAEKNDIVFVGWHVGGWRRRKGLEIHCGGVHVVTVAGILPPLHPAMVPRGHRLDSDVALATYSRFVKLVWPLRWMSNVLFVLLFVVLPCTLLAVGLGIPTWSVLSVVLALWVITAVWLLLVVRRTYSVPSERPAILATVASPISVVRALDAVAKPLLAAWHPVSVAYALSPREEYLALARHLYFSPGSPDALLVRQFLESVGDIESITAPPPRDHSCDLYCPRCHSQFGYGATICPDCEISLRPHGLDAVD